MAADAAATPRSSFAGRLDRYFEISRRGSSISTEIRGGAATFLTMAYILFVNPQILGSVAAPGGVKLPFEQLLTVTALVAGLATIAMGIIGRYPFALAAGLGINAFVAFALVGADHLSWPDAMGVIVAEGVLITLLVVVGFREAVINAIPQDIKLAIGIGIGLFITIIGLVNAGIVIKGTGTVVSLAPHLDTWPIAVFVVGLFGTYALFVRRVPGALLLGIVGTTVLATVINELKDKKVFTDGSAVVPSKVVAAPDFHLVGQFSFHFFSALGFWSAVAIVLSVMLSDFFDTAGTVLGLGRRAGLVTPDGRLPGMRRVLLVDSMAAAAGGAASASSNTTFIESSAGIAEGARTGLASVVTGALFLLCLFISPLAGVIPAAATAPVLVIVGAMMLELFRHVEWTSPGIALPVLLTIVMMPMTYSITNGVGAGFIAYSVLALLSGRRVHPLMLGFSAVFVWYFIHGAVA
ncbi:MAG: adenine/guanine/hypoxanthine permease [Solirubrobacteraceae bacterium]|jgi:AGZA family xanthine/uracil permease-like MFS transporter|nr:adenine/guanine/hypoxanthine permease [Solirubrobacteraceae bacterium]MEA2357634.1 adenine/guanine/hypoxanthine permease [Solirubrobacteraceae bacterium]